MPKAKPSPRQQEILDLMKEGTTNAREIAEVLGTSEGAVYQQISRLRAVKLLPKAKRGGSRPTLHTSSPVPQTAPKVSASNGHLPSLEDHLSQELGGVTERIAQIVAERAEVERVRQERLDALASEEGELTARQHRLTEANKALTPA